MNYQKIYNNIILRAELRKLSGYKEKHHIIPRCIGGSDNPKNVVELTAREHYVAHQLLVKLYPNHSGLLYAARMMTVSGNTQKRSKNRLYEWLKIRNLSHGNGDKNSQFGTCWVSNFNLKEARKIQITDLHSYLENGWVSGRIIRFELTKAESDAILMVRNGSSIYQACKQNNLDPSKQNYARLRIVLQTKGQVAESG